MGAREGPETSNKVYFAIVGGREGSKTSNKAYFAVAMVGAMEGPKMSIKVQLCYGGS